MRFKFPLLEIFENSPTITTSLKDSITNGRLIHMYDQVYEALGNRNWEAGVNIQHLKSWSVCCCRGCRLWSEVLILLVHRKLCWSVAYTAPAFLSAQSFLKQIQHKKVTELLSSVNSFPCSSHHSVSLPLTPYFISEMSKILHIPNFNETDLSVLHHKKWQYVVIIKCTRSLPLCE